MKEVGWGHAPCKTWTYSFSLFAYGSDNLSSTDVGNGTLAPATFEPWLPWKMENLEIESWFIWFRWFVGLLRCLYSCNPYKHARNHSESSESTCEMRQASSRSFALTIVLWFPVGRMLLCSGTHASSSHGTWVPLQSNSGTGTAIAWHPSVPEPWKHSPPSSMCRTLELKTEMEPQDVTSTSRRFPPWQMAKGIQGLKKLTERTWVIDSAAKLPAHARAKGASRKAMKSVKSTDVKWCEHCCECAIGKSVVATFDLWTVT